MKKIILFCSCMFSFFLILSMDVVDIKAEQLSNSSTKEFGNLSKSSVVDSKIYDNSLRELDDKLIIEQANQCIENCEMALYEKNTSVIQELNCMLDTYNKELEKLIQENNKDKSQIENVSNLIISIEDSISNYENYERMKRTYAKTVPNSAIDITGDEANLALLALHSAIVTHFSNEGYALAAELLQYMDTNRSVNSVYKPVNAIRVTRTRKYNEILNSTFLTSSIDFEKDGSVEGNDAYYALHLANYNKTSNNSGVIISDRYDFEFKNDYDDILNQAAVDSMYILQKSGWLVPYYVILEFSECKSDTIYHSSIALTNTQKYKEWTGILGASEELELSVVSTLGGYKTIQTFGPNDTYLSLYTQDGDLLISNDDSGYRYNGLINYNFEAGKFYTLKVILHQSHVAANVRVSISSINCQSFDNIAKITKTKGILRDYYKDINIESEVGYSNAYTLENNDGKSFILETIKDGNDYVDTVLYIIDPRRSNYYDNCKKYDENGKLNKDYYPLYMYDDDSAGNHQAKIEVPLSFFAKDTSYLIISSLFDLSKEGNYKIKITD